MIDFFIIRRNAFEHRNALVLETDLEHRICKLYCSKCICATLKAFEYKRLLSKNL